MKFMFNSLYKVRHIALGGLILAGLISHVSLVYATQASGTTHEIAYLAYADGYWQAWVMSAEGKGQKQMTFSRYDKNRVSWFPDGKHLLVSGSAGELVKVKIGKKKEIPILLKLKSVGDSVLSPDGEKIAFSHTGISRIDDSNIWIVNIDGSNPVKLTHKTGLQHEPVWSVDGKQIYFLSGKGGQAHDIWRLAIGNKTLEQLTAGQLYHFDLALSAKDDLAFSSNRSGNYEIWIQPKGAKKAARLTLNEALDAKPSWSPNGSHLVFESNRDGGISNIWKLRLKDKKLAKLTSNKVGARAPVWRVPVK